MSPFPLKALSSAALFGTTLLLGACGSSSGSSPSNALDGGSNPGGDGKSQVVNGPLDPVQDMVVSNVIGDTLGGSLPEPLGPTVQCAADALNSLVDGPDALLLALTSAGGGDPAAALQGAGEQLVGSLTRFAAELQSTLMALAGGSSCNTVATGSADGSPLGGNPLAGTPLEPLGAALEQLVAALGGFQGPGGDDPNLTSVTNAVTPLLAQLSSAFDMIPPEARQAPVVGGLFTTLQTATADLSQTLPFVGAYNPVGTNMGVEMLLNNLLSNVLLQVVPVAMIDEQTGQDFSGQIQAGIDTLTASLGSVSGQLITPLFNEVLNGAASPVLDPIEQLLQQLLGNLPLPGQSAASGNPLSGLLGGVAGDGSGNPLDALLALLTFGSDGSPLGALTGAVGGDAEAPQLDQLSNLLGNGALDGLLGQLAEATAGIPIVGGVVGTVLDLLGGLLGGGQG